jgi:hypothetical protein
VQRQIRNRNVFFMLAIYLHGEAIKKADATFIWQKKLSPLLLDTKCK